jgi:lysophospholipase L1-like esterase
MGVNALARFDNDVLRHPNVATVVLLEGINDIGWPGPDSPTPRDEHPTAEMIIAGYQQLVDRAHEHGVRVVACTLLPFADTFKEGPMHGYYTPEKNKVRHAVNDWIRTSGAFDGVIDFDALTRNPEKPDHIRAEYDSGDHLHPNDAGYKAMAEGVDLKLLTSASD